MSSLGVLEPKLPVFPLLEIIARQQQPSCAQPLAGSSPGECGFTRNEALPTQSSSLPISSPSCRMVPRPEGPVCSIFLLRPSSFTGRIRGKSRRTRAESCHLSGLLEADSPWLLSFCILETLQIRFKIGTFHCVSAGEAEFRYWLCE